MNDREWTGVLYDDMEINQIIYKGELFEKSIYNKNKQRIDGSSIIVSGDTDYKYEYQSTGGGNNCLE